MCIRVLQMGSGAEVATALYLCIMVEVKLGEVMVFSCLNRCEGGTGGAKAFRTDMFCISCNDSTRFWS